MGTAAVIRGPGPYSPPPMARSSPKPILQFHADDSDLRLPYVFHRVRRQGLRPQHRAHLGRLQGPGIQQHSPVLIAPDEIAPAQNMLHAGPAMGVDRHGLAWRNQGLDHAYAIVLHHQRMMLRRRHQGIERRRATFDGKSPVSPTPQRKKSDCCFWCRRRDSNLSRLAGVSAAGARRRNPEHREGPRCFWCRRRDSNPHTLAGTWT